MGLLDGKWLWTSATSKNYQLLCKLAVLVLGFYCSFVLPGLCIEVWEDFFLSVNLLHVPSLKVVIKRNWCSYLNLYFAADLNPTPAEIKAQKTFQDEMWVYRAVIMLLVLIILGLVLHQKVNLCQTIKTKVTTLKKCSGPKGEEAFTTLKHLSFSKM